MIQNPYIFILGAPRSGTTLLYRMLIKNQPNILGVDPIESQFYSKYYQKEHRLEAYIKNPFFLKYTSVDEVQKIFEQSRCSASFFRNYIDYCLLKEKKPYFVEKSPSHTLYWREIVNNFDSPKIILVRRDPRATIHSMVTAKWSHLFVDRFPKFLAQSKSLRYIAALFKYLHYIREYELIEGYKNTLTITFEDVVSEKIDLKSVLQDWLGTSLDELFVSRPFSAEVTHKEYKNDPSRLWAYRSKMPMWTQWIIKKIFLPDTQLERRLSGMLRTVVLGSFDHVGRRLISSRKSRSVSISAPS